MMIKSLIFDIGGVVMTNDWEQHYQAFAKRLKVRAEAVERYHDEYFDDLILGHKTFDDFLRDVLPEIDPSTARNVWIEEGVKLARVNDELLTMIDALRFSYNVQVLTNASCGRQMLDQALHLSDHFDRMHYSCDAHRMKPDPKFFEQPLIAARVEPSEAIYIDDNADLVAAGTALGMQGVVFTCNDDVQRL